MMAKNILNNQNALMLLVRVFVLLVCFPVHECAHAWTADKLGDSTGRRKGRITLNPFKHLDYMGTISILLIGIGYAKPVPVNIHNFRHKKRDFALTALAGPLSNLLMAIVFLVILRFVPNMHLNADNAQLARQLLTYAAYINVSLAVFNLIPIPPLDGSRVVTAFLPDRAYNKMLQKERYAMGVLLIALLCFNRMGFNPISFLTEKMFYAMRILITMI